MAVVGFVTAGCASYSTTPRLDSYDLTKGYRFERLPKSPATADPTNSDELFVVLAFSGGGTRAAALSYGVLAQLANVKFHWNAETGQPEVCEPATSPRCQAMARTLLDEVDVISSVSGGSFTSAHYALKGQEIFDTTGPFHRNFLYDPVQRDLLSHAVYLQQNWKRLRSRVEIAANDYARTIFGDTTFAALERSRPYLILNATDASTGARFEFTQEQFDLLCAVMSGRRSSAPWSAPADTSARSPCAPVSCATCWISRSFRPVNTTSCPALRASVTMAAPIPWLPPVTGNRHVCIVRLSVDPRAKTTRGASSDRCRARASTVRRDAHDRRRAAAPSDRRSTAG